MNNDYIISFIQEIPYPNDIKMKFVNEITATGLNQKICNEIVVESKLLYKKKEISNKDYLDIVAQIFGTLCRQKITKFLKKITG